VCCSHVTTTSVTVPVSHYCSMLQCDAVCCRVLQCVAVCCIELQCVSVMLPQHPRGRRSHSRKNIHTQKHGFHTHVKKHRFTTHIHTNKHTHTHTHSRTHTHTYDHNIHVVSQSPNRICCGVLQYVAVCCS